MNSSKAIIFCALLLTTACAPTIAERGNMLTDNQLKSVTVGTSTKSDVLHTLGSPTTKAAFDENDWFYIGQETEKHGILDPKIIKERIVEVKFAENGTLSDVHEVPKGAGVDVPISRDKTPTYGNEVTVMQQFLGNLGRFNKADKGNTSRSDQGGAGAPHP